MLELAYQQGGSERVVPLARGVLLLGHSPSCSVVLAGRGIAARQAQVVVERDRCRLVDLGSEGGTYLNGVRVSQAVLKGGDQIRLGEQVLHVRRALEHRVVLDAGRPMADDTAGAIIHRVGDLQQSLGVVLPGGERPAPPTRQPSEPAELAKANRILRSLSELAQALIAAQPEDVPRRVMDAVFEHIRADRGFIMLREEGGSLEPRVVKYRNPAEEARITISKTMADRVVHDRVAILTSDAQVDPRFSAHDSIRSHRIRSAMCAPLWKGDAVIGIIHVDTPVQVNSFTKADLELLSALANYAAVAIEQARLNQKIRDERFARERLEKYFSPSVVARILSEGEKEAQELEATILFADIVGFTRLAEKMTPPAVAELLNDCLSFMAEAVFEQEGTVDKFVGDCIMAVFGAPYAQADHAVRAVRVALRMRRCLAELNEARRPRPPIEMRIGINSGRVIAGPIGSAKRKEITVLGDAVNVASRLESAVARAGAIVVGERTFELVKDVFVLGDLGRVALEGKEEGIEAYEVLAERSGGEPGSR
jgi:adenylate cyclase